MSKGREPVSWECARHFNGKWPSSNTFIYRLYANTFTTNKVTKAIIPTISRCDFKHACERLGIVFEEV